MKQLPKTIYVKYDAGDEYLSVFADPGAHIENAGDSVRVGVYELTHYVDVKSTITTEAVAKKRR